MVQNIQNSALFVLFRSRIKPVNYCFLSGNCKIYGSDCSRATKSSVAPRPSTVATSLVYLTERKLMGWIRSRFEAVNMATVLRARRELIMIASMFLDFGEDRPGATGPFLRDKNELGTLNFSVLPTVDAVGQLQKYS